MADRSVIYRLVADASQFKMGMASARSEAAKTGTALEASGKKGEAGFSATEKAAGGLALVIAGKAISAAADFEQAMSGVQAATHESAASMDALRQAAMDAGAQTKFSATEAAAGIENLAKAGVQTSDILNGGLTGALDLAAAGNLEVGQAAEIAATALTQFNLAGEDVPHVADLLAAGAGKAQGEVTDLSQALNQAGLVAGQMGLSIEETTGTLSAFASAGLLGSDAGTSLKTMLLRLANPSKEARKEMERFGISAYDAQGNMLPMADIAEQIKTGFQGQSQATRDAALATIFGSDAIRAANVLYTEGADGITDWTTKVNDAGFAAETAAIKMDNLRGDLEVLMGSIETGLIGAGDGSQDSLRGATQGATELLDVLNQINSLEVVDRGTSTLGMGGITPDILELGISNLKATKNAIFGVDDATKDGADSADLYAAETTRLGQSAEYAATASQKSAEELKAQADALEDAREAAHETSMSFVDLTAKTDGAKASLGGWLKEMRAQADALRNFRENAKDAGENGIKKGLIDHLRTLGPEGARQMKWLANATKEQVGNANRDWKALQTEIAKSDKAMLNLHKPKVEVDAAPAFASFKAIDQWLSALDGKTATTYVKTVTSHSLQNTKLRAAGGPIYGPGTATSDDIPVMASNGEYMIKAAAVNHYGVGFFDRANAMHLAGGGPIGNASERLDVLNAEQAIRELIRSLKADGKNKLGPKARELAEAELAVAKAQLREAQKNIGQTARDKGDEARDAQMEKGRAEQEANQDALDAFNQSWMEMLGGQEKATNEWLSAAEEQKDAAEKIRDDVAAAMSTLAAGSTAGFQSGLFGDSSKSIWGTGGAGPFGALTGDIAGLNARDSLQAQLAAAGLDGDALAAALTEGSNQDLAALLAGGRIQEFEDLFNQRAALTASVGTAAGQAAYGAQFAASQALLDGFAGQVVALEAALASITAQMNPVSAAAAEGYRMQGEILVGAIVNGGNVVARRG